MLTINYDASDASCAYADGLCDKFVLELAQKELTGEIVVSSANIISAIRSAVCRGIIPHTSICFAFGGQKITIDRNGRSLNSPKGFCDYESDWLISLLRGPISSVK